SSVVLRALMDKGERKVLDFADLPAKDKIYYQDSNVVIYCCDNREVLPLFPDKAFDLVLTDPPYGINHPTDYKSRGRGKLANCNNYAPVFGDDKPFDPT